MRERAEVWEFHVGTWRTTPGPAGWTVVRCSGTTEADEFGPGGLHDTFVFQMDTSSTAEHIASWHPAVALAVADWLEATVLTDANAPFALAVARAYLGSDT
jgi:hypothetical protein